MSVSLKDFSRLVGSGTFKCSFSSCSSSPSFLCQFPNRIPQVYTWCQVDTPPQHQLQRLREEEQQRSAKCSGPKGAESWSTTVDGRNPANQLRAGSLSHFLGFYTSQVVWSPDFSSPSTVVSAPAMWPVTQIMKSTNPMGMELRYRVPRSTPCQDLPMFDCLRGDIEANKFHRERTKPWCFVEMSQGLLQHLKKYDEISSCLGTTEPNTSEKEISLQPSQHCFSKPSKGLRYVT